VAEDARAVGATVYEIGCDLARLADVRAAGQKVGDLLDAGAVRPLRGLVANAGVMSVDTHDASADGYELTFAVNYLAHAQLIGDLLGSFAAPAPSALGGQSGGVRTGIHAGYRVGQRCRSRHAARGARDAAIPGVSSPTRLGPAPASIVLDDRWAHLRDGAFVVKDEERQVKPSAQDATREARLWEATAQLLSFNS
jgi:hypothetical protein